MGMREFEYFVQICEPGSLSAMYQFQQVLRGHPSMVLEVEIFESRLQRRHPEAKLPSQPL